VTATNPTTNNDDDGDDDDDDDNDVVVKEKGRKQIPKNAMLESRNAHNSEPYTKDRTFIAVVFIRIICVLSLILLLFNTVQIVKVLLTTISNRYSTKANVTIVSR
jgi:hypothetical protein